MRSHNHDCILLGSSEWSGRRENRVESKSAASFTSVTSLNRHFHAHKGALCAEMQRQVKTLQARSSTHVIYPHARATHVLSTCTISPCMLFSLLVCRNFQHVRADANEDRRKFAALWTWHGKGYLFRRGGIMPPSSSFAKLVVGPEDAPACMAPLS